MSHLKKFIAVGAAVLGLFALAVAPASATHRTGAGAGVFTGTATLTDSGGNGLSYPISTHPSCANPRIPDASGPIGVCPNETGSWALVTDLGVGAALNLNGPQGAIGNLSIDNVSGTVHPNLFGAGVGAFCGVSGGTQTGAGSVTVEPTIAGTNPITTSVDGIRWVTSAATVIVFDNAFTHSANSATTFGVTSAIPPAPVPGADSCINNSAKTFQVVGASVLVDFD
jgi:hypothetical protein